MVVGSAVRLDLASSRLLCMPFPKAAMLLEMHALEHAAAAGTCILANPVTIVACIAQKQQLASACTYYRT